jgi:6-phosphogluconate dehydrogenase (decarboxylating)
MQIRMIRLGRMGSNMVHRLLPKDQECVVVDQELAKLVPLLAMRNEFGGHLERAAPNTGA